MQYSPSTASRIPIHEKRLALCYLRRPTNVHALTTKNLIAILYVSELLVRTFFETTCAAYPESTVPVQQVCL